MIAMKRNDRLNEVFRKFRQKRALRRFISLFSVFVLLLTINTLKMNADTLERIPSCGIAEHAHGAECFDEAGNLICGLAEHVHTDACYQERPKGTVEAETLEAGAVEADVRETDDLELDGCDTDGDAIPEAGIPADEGDAIRSEAMDAVVEELDGLTLDDSVEDEGTPEEQPDGGDEDPTAEDAESAEDAEPAEDTEEEEPGTLIFSLKDREFVLASELAGAMGLDMARVLDVAAVENEDGTANGIGIEALGGDWLIYAAQEFDEAGLAFIIDEGIEVVTLTDGVPLTAPESAPDADGAADETYLEEDTADAAADIADAPTTDAQVAVEVQDDEVIEDNNVEIGADTEDVAEEMPTDEDAPAEDAPADEDAPAEDAPAVEDEVIDEATEETIEETADETEEEAAAAEADEDKADEEKSEEVEADEEKAEEVESDEEKSEEEESNEEKAEEEKTDEEKSEEEEADEEKADEEKADEEKADEEKADEEKAEEYDAEGAEDGEDAEDVEGAEDAEDGEDGEDAEDGAEDEDADGEAFDEDGASGSYGAGDADGRAVAPAADDYTLTVDLSVEQDYPLSLRGLMAGFRTAPVAEEAEVQTEAEAQTEAEQTEVGNDVDVVAPDTQEETVVGSDIAAESDVAGKEPAAAASDDEILEDEIIESEAVEAAVAEVEVTMAAPEPAVEAPAPAIDPEAALAESVAYDDTLLSVEETGEDWLITPVASFEKTEIVVGGVYTIAFINCTVEAPVAMPARTFEGATDYITVKVEAGEGAFPEGTTMQLTDIEDEGVLTDIGDAAVTDDFVEVKRVHAVDITFRDAEGNEIEPLIPISVVMGVREIEQDQEAVVVHVDDDGNAEVVEGTGVSDADGALAEAFVAVEAQAENPGGDAAPEAESIVDEAPAQSVSFMADAFSIYAMVVTQKIETKIITAEGETYNITVSYGPEAEIPMGAMLSVSEIEGDSAQDYLERTEETLEKAQLITRARFFDIKIMDGESEVQPAVPVTVQAVLADESQDADAVPCAVHFAGDNVEQPDVVEAAETGETVVFRAASFSVWGVVYTVDFHWTVNGETFDYSIPGGDCASLRELLGLLNMVADDPETETNELDDFMAAIESVTFSAPELVRVHKIEEDTTVGALRAALEVESEYSAALTDEQRAQIDARELAAGDWALFSLKPFSTLETLTIAMDNGDAFAIAVTDAQITTRVLTADGERFIITLDYGPEAMIPLDAELKATEIEKGTIEWDAYCGQARQAAGIELGCPLDFARFFDIEILKDGEKLEPQATVSVNIALADMPEDQQDNIKVVHYVEDGPVVMESRIADAERKAGADEADVPMTHIQFETDSFSTYGVITMPTTQQFGSGDVGDLVGKGFTMSCQNNYVTATQYDKVENGKQASGTHPAMLGHSTNEADAAVWYLEPVGNESAYKIYTFVSGVKKYIAYVKEDEAGYFSQYGTTANATLNEYWGTWFTVINNNNDTYTLRGDVGDQQATNNSQKQYYLNFFNNAGFAGFYVRGPQDGRDGNGKDSFVLNTITYPANDNENYFVLLKNKKNDKYYLVLNDGRLEEVTVNPDTHVFEATIEPMMWKFKEEDGYQYLTHESYARTTDSLKLTSTWYWSYIDPNSESGFNDPDVAKIVDWETQKGWEKDFLMEHPDDNTGAKEYRDSRIAAATNDTANNNKKEQSRIIIETVGGVQYIKSATTGNYIGVTETEDGVAMTGLNDFDGAAEVYFANLDRFISVVHNPKAYWEDWSNMARYHIVNHIDIGINAKAQLHIPLAPQTYYVKEGGILTPCSVTQLQMLRVEQTVPIIPQDIKNAKLMAFQYDNNGNMVKLPQDDAYFITGYSGNASTGLSEVQVRIEGQFKVAMFKSDPAHESGGLTSGNRIPDGIDPYEPSQAWREWRRDHQVYYNVTVKKDVPFDLKIDGKQLYDAAGNKLTYTTPVELTASFSYWDTHNECPALREGFEANNPYWKERNYSEDGLSDYRLGWLNNSGGFQSIIPQAANGGSGMDFRLGGVDDQTAIVITKYVEKEDGTLIKLNGPTTSTVDVWQKDLDSSNPKALTDLVNEKYTQRPVAQPYTELWGASDRPYGMYGTYNIIGSPRVIDVSEEGCGTIYDFDVPVGMVGINETGYPSTVTDKNGVVWTYHHTYIKTDYVSRKTGDNSDKYHFTRDYTNDDLKVSVPEVLGPYKRDDSINVLDENGDPTGETTDDDTSDFLEFYIHNVYVPSPIQVEVRKDWKNGNETISAPDGATVDVYLKRYKLVPKEEFDPQTDSRVTANVNILLNDYTPNPNISDVYYSNSTDFKAGDKLTVKLDYKYNASVRYSTDDKQTWTSLYNPPERPEGTGGEGYISATLTDIKIPDDGALTIYIDDVWMCVKNVTVTKVGGTAAGNQSSSHSSISDAPVPVSPVDKPDMVYVVDTSWPTQSDPENVNKISVTNQGGTWKGTSGNLDAYDGNGNKYLYFIYNVVEGNAGGAQWVIEKASNGAYMTSTGETELVVTNQVPIDVSLTKKSSADSSALSGAKFQLKALKNGQWQNVGEEIDMSSTPNGTITGLFDGRYALQETKSPDGFNLPSQLTYFRVKDGQVYLTNADGENDTAVYNNMIILSGKTLTVKNTPGVSLPSTGGVGTTMFYVAGGLITLLALALLITKRRAD